MRRPRLSGSALATPVVVFVLVLVACAGGSGAGSGADNPLTSNEETEFRKNIESALCEHAATCCRLHGFDRPAPACDIRDVVPVVNEIHVPVAPPLRDYAFDSREAARCLAAVRARASTCRIPGYLPECRQVWHVGGELGSTCTHSADCSPSSLGFVRCIKRCVLTAPQDNFPGSGLPVGAPCKDPRVCATGNCQNDRCAEDFYTKPRVCAPASNAR